MPACAGEIAVEPMLRQRTGHGQPPFATTFIRHRIGDTKCDLTAA